MNDIVITNIFLLLYGIIGMVTGALCVRHEMNNDFDNAAVLGMIFIGMFFFWPLFVCIVGPCWLVGKVIKFVFNKFEG